VVATPTDLAFGLNVSQIESKQASPPATMNSVAAFASQLGNIQAQFGVSSASLNTSSLAAVSNALPLPINDIATAAAHYVKAQLLSAGPSSFSNLGPRRSFRLQRSPVVLSETHTKANPGEKKKQKRKDLLTPAAQAEVQQILQKSKPGCCASVLSDTITCATPTCGRRWHAACVNSARYPKELHYGNQPNWKCPVCMTCGCCNRIFLANKRKVLQCKQCVLFYLVGRGHTQYCVCCGGDIDSV